MDSRDEFVCMYVYFDHSQLKRNFSLDWSFDTMVARFPHSPIFSMH